MERQIRVTARRKKALPVIDVSYVEIPEQLTHRVLNASSVLGSMAFMAMILAPAFVEENPIMSIVMAVAFGVCAHLSMKEDGQIK